MPDAQPTRFPAGRGLRLSAKAEISRVFNEGHRVGDRRLSVLARPNGLSVARVAVAVSKRHGNAVVRNRLKRLCREAFRMVRPEIAVGFDYVILPRVVKTPSLLEIQDSIRALAPKAIRSDSDAR